MTLLVVRHGLAMARDEFQIQFKQSSDDLRPLTLVGIRKMQKNARGLKALVRKPDLLLSSPLVRAQQTAEILQEVWGGLELSVSEHLRPTSKPQPLASSLNSHVVATNDNPLICIVGHEPHLSQLVTWFLKGSGFGAKQKSLIELKKGGACLLEFPHEIAKAQATLQWLATPAFLKAID